LRTFEPWTVKPEVALADGLVPVKEIAGVQPSELTFGVQYATGAVVQIDAVAVWNPVGASSARCCSWSRR